MLTSQRKPIDPPLRPGLPVVGSARNHVKGPIFDTMRPRFALCRGPRQCIGKNFALYEAAVVLSMAAQRFDWQLAPGEKVIPELRVTFRPGAVRMALRERENQLA